MNYRHAYHAGSFTDVIKHIILITLIEALSRKESPFCYLDTHAGAGYYDLSSNSAVKNTEYVGGIGKIIQQANPPGVIQRYLGCIQRINNQLTLASSLNYYPGSPMIARYFMRPHDKLIACELQPQEYQLLKHAFAGDKQAAIHHMDGFMSLKAFLPPLERRGLVLIDPPYEKSDELIHIAKTLSAAVKHWQTGIYAIWYPIKEKVLSKRFYQTLQTQLPQRKLMIIELTIYPDLPQHLNGCGMAIINPPWQFDENINVMLPWLWKTLTINRQGHYSTFSF